MYLPVEEIEIDGKILLHVYVPESSQVHNTNQKIFDRNEDGDFEITGNANLVANLYIRKQREYTENIIFPYATKDDLRADLIDRVRIMARNQAPHHPWETMTNDEILRSAGLYRKDMQTGQSGYTLAAILLFGTDEAIISALPHHKTDAIYRVGDLDRYDDRDVIRCNLIESYDKLMNFVEKHVDDKFYMEGDVRVSVRNKLFREIVVNLLIHREYSNAYPAKLIIEKDCVKTENGNKARGLGAINVSNFTPYPKNPVIASVFKQIGWAEELGSGVKNIVKYAKIYSRRAPRLLDGDVFETTVFTGPGSGRSSIGFVNNIPNDTANDTVNETVNISFKPSKVDWRVLKCIEENPLINVAGLMNVTGKSRSTILRSLRRLKDGNLIERTGSDKAGQWKVLK